MQDFEAQALVTKSPNFHGNLVPRAYFVKAVNDAIVALNVLDKIKKTMFYGAELPYVWAEVEENCQAAPKDWIVVDEVDPTIQSNFARQDAVDVIHATLGKATEGGEMLELLRDTLKTGKFDPVNFSEEMFDGQWYDAIGCHAIGMTFDQGQRMIIDKLRNHKTGRFKDLFNEFDAKNRDLEAERKTLVAGMKPIGRFETKRKTLVAGMEPIGPFETELISGMNENKV